MKIKKHKCCECGEMAVWYRPKKFVKANAFFYCDNCVPRGTSEDILNIEDFGEPPKDNPHIMWWSSSSKKEDFYKEGTRERKSDSFYYAFLDPKGRRLPSAHFNFSKSGYEKIEPSYYVPFDSLIEIYKEHKTLLTKDEDLIIGEIIDDAIDKSESPMEIGIDYNKLMSVIGDEIITSVYELKGGKNRFQNLLLFFRRFKRDLSQCKVNVNTF